MPGKDGCHPRSKEKAFHTQGTNRERKVPLYLAVRQAEHVRAILLYDRTGESLLDNSFRPPPPPPCLQRRSFMHGLAVDSALAEMKILCLAAVDISTASFPSPVHEEEIEGAR